MIFQNLMENESSESLKHLTIPEYLLKLYDHINGPERVLKEILYIESLSFPQLECIIDLQLLNLHDCLVLFGTWVIEGLYDFSSLPFPLKSRMRDEDRTLLDNLPGRWDGTPSELTAELKSLNETLKQSEAEIIANMASQVSVF